MYFYDLLQLDPAALKQKIRSAATQKERLWIYGVTFIRSLLIVAFAMLLITPASAAFGSENSAMAVAIFCILLSVRFVDFGYCIRDSLCCLAVVFLLLFISPVAAALLPLWGTPLVHFVTLFLILLMTSQVPEMGNGGLYGFAYVFLVGNPVTGDLLLKRGILVLIGFLVCGAIFYGKHRKKHQETHFSSVVKDFKFSCKKSRWQLRMAFGVSLVLTLGALFHLERFMWAGFACSSLLSTYAPSSRLKERLADRIFGVIVGSLLFLLVYQITPDTLRGSLGILGGICLGFCANYRFKTILNCFGALSIAAGLYGIQHAVFLRILDNVLGVVFGYLFFFLCQQLVRKWIYFRKTAIQKNNGTT